MKLLNKIKDFFKKNDKPNIYDPCHILILHSIENPEDEYQDVRNIIGPFLDRHITAHPCLHHPNTESIRNFIISCVKQLEVCKYIWVSKLAQCDDICNMILADFEDNPYIKIIYQDN